MAAEDTAGAQMVLSSFWQAQPVPACHLFLSWCHYEQCALMSLSPCRVMPWWRPEGLEDIAGPHHRPEGATSSSCSLLPVGPCTTMRCFFSATDGPIFHPGAFFQYLVALLVNNFVQHVLKVLVTSTVLPNRCFFLVWHTASHSEQKIIVWLNC